MPTSNTTTTTNAAAEASSSKKKPEQSVTVAADHHNSNKSSHTSSSSSATPLNSRGGCGGFVSNPSRTSAGVAGSLISSAFGGGRKKTKQQQQEQQQVKEEKNAIHYNSRPRSMISYIPLYLQRYVAPYHGDYCYSRCFDARLLAQLMVEGFLPIATPSGRDSYILLPKLHEQRCVIPLQQEYHDSTTTVSGHASWSSSSKHIPTNNGNHHCNNHLHISKSIRKKSKKFYITINQAFDQVVQGCHEQHGHHCWLYPPLVKAFETLHHHRESSPPMQASIISPTSTTPWPSSSSSQQLTSSTCPVRVYSIEVWSTDDTSCTDPSYLVAGELGYTIGQGNSPDTTTTTTGTTTTAGSGIYTSLTGFSRQDSAGSVQMAALGQMLVQAGFALWDLGMDMNYKQDLGAVLMERDEFVRNVHALRKNNTTKPLSLSAGTTKNNGTALNATPLIFDTCAVRRNCRNVIDGNLSTSSTATSTTPTPASLPSLSSTINRGEKIR